MIPGVASLVYTMLPRCDYTLREYAPSIAPDADALAADPDALPAREPLTWTAAGLPDYGPPVERPVNGALAPASVAQLRMLDDGVTSDGVAVFTTREVFELPGHCNRVPVDARYVLVDREGIAWKLIQRRRIACVNEYTGVPYCVPYCD